MNRFKKQGTLIYIVLLVLMALIVTNIYNDGESAKDGYLTTVANSEDFVVQRKEEKHRNSKIKIHYPMTKYEVLNNEVQKLYEEYVSMFKKEVTDDTDYEIVINFDASKYDKYINFVFRINMDLKAAHPSEYISTINYDINNNSVVNTDTLCKLNNNILNNLSQISYDKLSNDENIKKADSLPILQKGTKPEKQNFKNFIFTDKGLKVFFQKYQVAPYSSGEFIIVIPYSDLNLNIL